MGLDPKDTVKSILGSLKTEVGITLIAVLFSLQVFNIISGTLAASTGLVSALGFVLSLAVTATTLVVAIGAFRALDSGELEKEYFTENLVWPILRVAGSNIVMTAFAAIALIPILPARSLLAGAAGMGMVGTALGVLSLLVGLWAFFYALLSLSVSLPEIVVEDNRLFESLDNSIQRTHGDRAGMFVALLPLLVLYTANLALTVAAGAGGTLETNPIMMIGSGLLGSITAVTAYSTLVEYNKRL